MTALPLATNGNIAPSATGVQHVNPLSDVTGIVLQAGTQTGQSLRVINDSAYTVTFSKSVSTSRVAGSDAGISIAPTRTADFLWESTTGSWSLAAPGLNFINVKDLGVQGDGVTDDTTNITNALSAASAGGVVFFPSGTYKLSSALTVPSNVILQGGGSGTVLSQSSTSADALSGTDLSAVTIRDMQITGPGSGTGKGIHFTLSSHAATTYLNMENVTVQSFGSDGINITNAIVSTFNRVVSQSNGGYGFNLYGQTSPGAAGTSVSLVSCYGNGNTSGGYRLYNMVYTSLHGCASDNQPINYLLDTCQSVSLVGCGSEGNTTNAFKVTGGYGITLVSPWVYDNHADAIYITGSAHTVTIIGATDNTPHAGATSFIKTDAGTNVALLSCNNTTANSLASGTVTTVVDNVGNVTIPAQLNVTNGATIKFGTALDTDLYRLGANSLATDGLFTAYGAINSQGGSTLYSGSGAPSGGNNGDYYFRTDTPGTANQRLYVKSGGSWVGIV